MITLKRNVGDIDSRIRNRLGMILILVGVLGFFDLLELSLLIKIVMIAVGAVLFLTGSSRRCAIYSIFGLDTTKSEEKGDRSL